MVVFPLSVSPLFLSLGLPPASALRLSPLLFPLLPSASLLPSFSPPSPFLLFLSSTLPLSTTLPPSSLSPLSFRLSLPSSSTILHFSSPTLPLTSTFTHFPKSAQFPSISVIPLIFFRLPACALALHSSHSIPPVSRIVKRTPLRTPPLAARPFSITEIRQPVPPLPAQVSNPHHVSPLLSFLPHQTE